jgi:hypothetical protein
MCLTGVDYFSSLGYQPSIAFTAAGFLSPLATLVLVGVTLFGALPVYSRIAALSPRGQGSLSVLEERLPRWRGKAFVLCLLGFAATDFVITITLSAADATAHVLENPFVPQWIDHPILFTVLLVSALGAIFLKGFREAIWVAVLLVGVYLVLNVIVIGRELEYVVAHGEVISIWSANLLAQEPRPWMIAVLVIWFFPKLALGLSGFETGVAVMPLVSGQGKTEEQVLASRIANTRKLLATAAIIMSTLLICSSIIVATLVPKAALAEGGSANGRALAYLAHRDFGEWFGTLYDISTISILWFAGASAMAGLLNLVPKYLPRYGMAPDWARATRPLVMIITGIAVLVTILFDANVEKQGGAYATGVLMLMTSAAVAVTLSTLKRRKRFALITIGFFYTTIVNIIERPEGLKIATWFIVTIVVSSMISRVMRSTELRQEGIDYDEAAQSFIKDASRGGETLRILASRPNTGAPEEYARKLRDAFASHHLPDEDPILFLEVRPGDTSEFANVLHVQGVTIGNFNILRCTSPAIPNAIAGLLLDLRDRTGCIPHAYFGWTEGNPITYLLKFLAFGEGDTAPVCREVLRKAEAIPARRPRIHVG